MSEAKAKLSFARISPRKVNVVCALIRGKDIEHGNCHLAAHSQGCL